MLKGVPLIHDDSLSSRAVMPTWADWFAAAGVTDADVSRGLRFNSADHALDATVEGAGVLLALDVLAYDDLRTGRLVMPFDLILPSGRCYAFVCPKRQRDSANVRAFRAWLRQEAAALDWSEWATRSSRLAARGGIVRGALSSSRRKSGAPSGGFDRIARGRRALGVHHARHNARSIAEILFRRDGLRLAVTQTQPTQKCRQLVPYLCRTSWKFDVGPPAS